ncbi:efflux RND transporter periplasmic adaptor subunit [Gabonibacter chumensis]|uniref:efflux RND transporter periplasmic adaptor subunit n=1 Tax=Gabonibacter chumensis TaxID=2972474 RepID=UPI0025737988|nr:efflux RND transporter periplasmic adaptor subunit [Gabonibacter chumensis]MCR9011061.1 efflux RND transporter periplasmic adaptor subunit [Gabonibacter chumensis]
MKMMFFSVLKWAPVIGALFVVESCRRAAPGLEIPQLVKTAEIQKYEGESSTNYPGKIKAASDVKLAFRVAGPIIRFRAKEGEYVKKGQVLAEIDPRDYKLQFDATAAEYKQIKGESERVMELYRRKSVPVNDYDKAVAALKRITALYEAHRNALNDTKLRAPFDGYIQKKFFDAHEIVNQGLPVLSMINDNYFEIDIDIPSSDYIRRENFVSSYCVADVYPGTKIPLELLEIAQQANYNQLFKVRFRLKPEQKLNIAAGMSATVTIDFMPGKDDLALIPISALFQKDGKSYVWSYEKKEGKISKSLVEIVEIQKDGMVLVQSELLPGSWIVTAGVNHLKEGQKVRQLPPVSTSNVGKLL